MLFANIYEVLNIVLDYMAFRQAHQGLGYCGEIDLICRITGCERRRLMAAARAYRRYRRTRFAHNVTWEQNCRILHRLAAYVDGR